MQLVKNQPKLPAFLGMQDNMVSKGTVEKGYKCMNGEKMGTRGQ